ncbi:hypothetical protein PHYBLDRAFT_188162 [Phycomyces blakesleeanus NRRL 1555(-)]|uniref:PWWP domain-containing protein n=1 Tax=Phycomyces blakesleeanus (strain ATCC 8743b / DSM 1359 / FGSC 10004 / NBRC 33097 / NRRL 1555) TaxID=763407 RepID=A0A162ZYE6_PHYB8|nr:hypothetical protein PHYBLDRAFT_188162 [Phycomyces blakesleeanus NRRL 1555(-)]OAD69851.1 hypothetical protein PHYBLDRAFT_188162 [Phycomyces blakesleeanus NRRL 1555(-)]|eukprot:XP_018287891.1 hypothetical protein PHYBLDRAFT_188162 [Phycomyces blakesleeanus NRRL 1555(-)]
MRQQVSPSTHPPGKIVFAKLKGYPWWPARIANEQDVPQKVLVKKAKTKCPLWTVRFFGTKDYGFVGADNIKPFKNEDVEKDLSEKKFKSKDLEDAVRHALDPSEEDPIIPDQDSPSPSPASPPSPPSKSHQKSTRKKADAPKKTETKRKRAKKEKAGTNEPDEPPKKRQYRKQVKGDDTEEVSSKDIKRFKSSSNGNVNGAGRAGVGYGNGFDGGLGLGSIPAIRPDPPSPVPAPVPAPIAQQQQYQHQEQHEHEHEQEQEQAQAQAQAQAQEHEQIQVQVQEQRQDEQHRQQHRQQHKHQQPILNEHTKGRDLDIDQADSVEKQVFKKVYHIRHKLQKLVYCKKPGEIPKEDYSKINLVIKEIEDIHMNYHLLKETKMGKVVKAACSYSYEGENEYSIKERCQQLLRTWKTEVLVTNESSNSELLLANTVESVRSRNHIQLEDRTLPLLGHSEDAVLQRV